MSLVALLVIIIGIAFPPFLKLPHSAITPNEADAPGRTVGQAVEGWNLTQSKAFSGVPDLLAVLRPLVVRPISGKNKVISDEDELAELLDRVNRFRLGQSTEGVNDGAAKSQPDLDKLLDDNALKAYVRNLFSENGEYDRLALVRGDFQYLEMLIPKNVDAATATTFRTLAHQLIGESAINEKGDKLSTLYNPFFDLADDQANRRSYQAMIENIPGPFRKADVGCTFFTVDDCHAANLICTYFKDIGFLTGDQLAFDSTDRRSIRLPEHAASKTLTSRYFARLLSDWQQFKHGQGRANRGIAVSPTTDSNE